MANGDKDHNPVLQFPTHNAPRVWLLTSGDSPLGISLTRQILNHGDCVVSGFMPSGSEEDGDSARGAELKDFLSDMSRKSGDSWKERLSIIALDIRCASLLQECDQSFQRLLQPCRMIAS
jgi:hypothetical protein